MKAMISKKFLGDFIKKNGIVKDSKKGFFKIKINNEILPLSWENAKKNRKFLKKFNLFRKKYVDFLLHEILDTYQCKPDCYLDSVGSSNLESDYDITVYDRDTSIIIEEFEHRFKQDFNKASSYIFDTNLYGASFFHSSTNQNYAFIVKKQGKCAPNNFIYYIDNQEDKKDIKNQHVWSFIKILKNIGKQSDKILEELLFNSTSQVVSDIISEAILKFTKLKSEKSNYLRELKRYNEIKHLYEIVNGVNIKLGVKLKEQLSLTEYYGEETYFTQGTVNHVVGKLQSKIKNIKITKNEYLDSMIENLGDIIKIYNKYTTDPILFCLHAGKYIYRASDASINIQKDPIASSISKMSLEFYNFRNKESLDKLIINKKIHAFMTKIKVTEFTSFDILKALIAFFMKKYQLS